MKANAVVGFRSVPSASAPSTAKAVRMAQTRIERTAPPVPIGRPLCKCATYLVFCAPEFGRCRRQEQSPVSASVQRPLTRFVLQSCAIQAGSAGRPWAGGLSQHDWQRFVYPDLLRPKHIARDREGDCKEPAWNRQYGLGSARRRMHAWPSLSEASASDSSLAIKVSSQHCDANYRPLVRKRDERTLMMAK